MEALTERVIKRHQQRVARYIPSNAWRYEHYRDRGSFGLSTLGTSSRSSGLVFYPVRHNLHKKTPSYAFYLDEQDLSTMVWKNQEWSIIKTVRLTRQQTELLFRLLRVMARTLESA